MISPDTSYFLSVVILMGMIGLAIGNYATSIIYRLPRGLKIPNDPPYCSSCRHYLAVRDLFPFFSWVYNRGKCRFCSAQIPLVYAAVEISSAILFITATLHFGLGEKLILILSLGMFLIILCSIYHQQKKIFTDILVVCFAIVSLLRTLEDGSIFPFIKDTYLGLSVGIFVWLINMVIARRKLPFPDYILLISLAAMSAGIMFLPWFFAIFLIGYAILSFLIFLFGNSLSSLKNSAWIVAMSFSIILLQFCK